MAMKKTPDQKMKTLVVRDMKNLNIYKKEYDRLIEIYVALNLEYDRAFREFERSGYQYETETGAGGTKKSALVSTLESLRKDILAYSDRLCLNPKTFNGLNIQVEKKSLLSIALKDL